MGKQVKETWTQCALGQWVSSYDFHVGGVMFKVQKKGAIYVPPDKELCM